MRTRETRTPTQRARIPTRTAECRAPRATQSTAPRDVAFPTAVARWASATLILAVSTGKRARRAPAAIAAPPAGACGRSWAPPAVRRTATVAVFLCRASQTLVLPTERPTRTRASWARKTTSADMVERSARAALRYMTMAGAYLKTEAPGAIAKSGRAAPTTAPAVARRAASVPSASRTSPAGPAEPPARTARRTTASAPVRSQEACSRGQPSAITYGRDLLDRRGRACRPPRVCGTWPSSRRRRVNPRQSRKEQVRTDGGVTHHAFSFFHAGRRGFESAARCPQRPVASTQRPRVLRYTGAAVRDVDRRIAEMAASSGVALDLAPRLGGTAALRGRLRTFERLGLAVPEARHRWRVSPPLLEALERQHREGPVRYTVRPDHEAGRFDPSAGR